MALAAVTVIRSAWQPLTAWDAWAFWTPKAESIVYFGGLSKTFLHSGIANPEYPPLIPAVESLTFRFMGAFDTTLVHVQFSLLLLGFVVAMTELVGTRPAARAGSVVLLLIASAPTLILQTTDAYADVPIAIFTSLAAITLWSAAFERTEGASVLAVVFLAATLATKLEGLLFASVMLAVLLFLARGTPRRQLRVAAIGFSSVLVALVPWRLWVATHDVHATHRFAADTLLKRPERFWEALSSITMNSVSFREWLLLPLASAGIAAFGFRSAETRRIATFMVATSSLICLALAAVYWGTTYPFHWYVDTTVDRVISTPILLLATLAAWLLSSGTGGVLMLQAAAREQPAPT